MKKTMKKLATLCVAGLMIVSSSVVAFAGDGYIGFEPHWPDQGAIHIPQPPPPPPPPPRPPNNGIPCNIWCCAACFFNMRDCGCFWG